MKHKLTLMMTALMLLITNAFTAFGQTHYEKVTSAPTDWSGEYILVYEESATSAYVWTGVDAVNCYNASSISQNVISAEQSVTITIATMDGGYSVKINGGDNDGKYISHSANSNGLSIGDDAAAQIITYGNNSVFMTNGGGAVMRFNSTSNQMRFRFYKSTSYSGQQPVQLYKKVESGNAVATPTFSPAAGTYAEAQTVTISCATEGATIYYTTDGTTPDTLSSIYYAPISITHTTTVKAIAVKEGLSNSSVATATYTIETPLTTMDEIFAKATAAGSTATSVTITFNNWVVTGVAGSNAYLTDGTKGLIIYGSGHGFTVGDHLTGTVSCKVQLYQGSSELTNLKTSTTGLTVTPGSTAEPVVMTIDQITSGVYTGAVITINNVSYDETESVLSDGTNTIKPFNKLYSGMSFTDGENYNVTGLYLQYNATKEIMPRNADDIELVQTPGAQVATPTFTPAAGTYTEAQNVTISCATEGATIYYTTDGTTPDTLSSIYYTPVSISETTTIKAIATKEGLDNSNIATATYTINIPQSGNFGLVSKASDITTDGTYLLVCVSAGTAATSTVSSSALQTAAVTVTDNAITTGYNTDGKPYTVTLETATGGYYIKLNNGKYINNSSSTGISASETASSVWAFNSYEGGMIAQNTSNNNRFIGGASAAGATYKAYAVSNLGGETNPVVMLFKKDLTPSVESVATPTFSPEAGTYTEAQNVTISCATEGATIYYTTDGTTPDTLSTVYSTPISITTTTTVKAIAMKDGLDNSEIATATYTFPGTITIAAARALENNEYALTEGIVTFIDGRNIYIQDTTAGIDLYLNSNTVPDTLALGDKVKAYGKKTVYNGLVELTGIDGGDASQFSIVSSGNELPLAVKTIAEINADYADGNMLQSTRVKIADSKIGAINTNGNTPIHQGENTINLYKMPVVEGLLENDSVTVIGIIGCFNAPQIRINSAADVEFTHPAGPSIAATPSELTGFSYTFGQGPSETQSFAVNGSNLTASATITASENFEISSADGGDFNAQSTITLNETSFSNMNIYVRLKAGLEIGEYNETLTFASEGAETVNIAVSGSVVEPQQPSEYVQIPDLALLANGAKVILAARYNDDEYAYFAMTATTSGKPEGVGFTRYVSENPAPGDYPTIPASIAEADTLYFWTVSINGGNYTFTNANGDILGYTSSTNFSTGGDNTAWTIEYSTSDMAAMVPSYNAFVITNVNNNGRAIALNTSHNFGPYAKSNMTGSNASNYNFFLDIFATTGGTPLCATPAITPESGTYYEVQSVEISCSTEGATIYYTTDGTEPTSGSAVYSAPITVTEDMTIKAIAMKEGYDSSSVATAEYTIILGSTTILAQDWEGEMNGWTFVTVEGSKPWTVAQSNGNHYAYANGYNDGVNEQWCISPAFNLNIYNDVTLSFMNAKNFTGPDMQVFLSNDYDGTNAATATWNELTYVKSTGSWAWVESGLISLDSYSGSNCHIGFKYTCTETEAAGWEVDDIIMVGFTSATILTASTQSLDGMTYITGYGPSAQQSFNITGTNLTSNVTLTMAGTDFEMSATGGDNFTAQPTITLTPAAGTVEQTIFVRLAEGLDVNDYSSSITIGSELDDITVTLAGTVEEQGDNWNRIMSVSDITDGASVIIAARYNDVENEYYAMTASTSGKPEGVLFTSLMDGSDEILPVDIVMNESAYRWTVNVSDGVYTFTNAAGDMIGYGGSGTNFQSNGDNTTWAIDYVLSDAASMVPEYWGFLITNTTSTTRAFAINSTYSYGPYSTQNMTGGNANGYNFCIDIFVQGGEVTHTVMTPVISPASGTYFNDIDVTITCATEGATIHYTTDGSTPTNVSPIYSEAIHVSEDMTVKAIGVKDGYVDSSIATAEYTIMTGVNVILAQDWENEMNGWQFVTVQGNKPWDIDIYDNNKYAKANGYGDDTDNEQWCVSPAFNLTQHAGNTVTLNFMNATKFEGPALELLFSNDYDGQDVTAATWQPLTFNMSEGNYEWAGSGEISLSQFSGSICNIAFKYTSTPEAAAAWEIDDIMLYATPNTDPYIIPSSYSMTGFDYVYDLGPSTTQSFTLTAGNLVGDGVVTITSSENFKLTLDEDSWSNEISLEYANGQLIGQPVTVYVRMKCGLEIGTYDGDITIDGGGASCQITLEGEVTPGSSVTENIEENVNIFQNGNNIIIKNDTNKNLTMMMYNILGQPVMTETVTTGDNRIKHNLTTGAYIIRLTDGSSVMSRKIVVR